MNNYIDGLQYVLWEPAISQGQLTAKVNRRVSCNEECVCLKQTIGVNHVSVSELRTDFDVGEHCTNAHVEKLDELLRMNAGAFAQDDNQW